MVPKALNSTTVTVWLRRLEFVVRRVSVLGNDCVYVSVCPAASARAKSREATSEVGSPPIAHRRVRVGCSGLGANLTS
jgi:hypothetical protein